MLLLARCRQKTLSSDIVLHVWIGHHGVRDDAYKDVDLVFNWCNERGIDCVVGYYDGAHTE